MKAMLDIIHRGHTNPERKNSRKPFKWILLDSVIIGGIAAWACAPNWIPSVADIWVMFKAFCGAFLLQVAVERGIKRVWK